MKLVSAFIFIFLHYFVYLRMKNCKNCYSLYNGIKSICVKCQNKLIDKEDRKEKKRRYNDQNKAKLKQQAKFRSNVLKFKKELDRQIEDKLIALKNERNHLLKLRAIK